MSWLIFILGVSQFPVSGFVFDGGHNTFSYRVGSSVYLCPASQLVSFSWPNVNLKGQCPLDRVHYSGFQK